MVYSPDMPAPSASVSIVCVYNNVRVREECLDRSIHVLQDEAADVEYLPVDNVSNAFASAGAALNHGVRMASNDVIVFVHQDVFLHSLTVLKEVAGRMSAGGFGLLGAAGISSDGRIIGRVRDRVVLIGEVAAEPVDVDSVDEVLFMAPRSQLLAEPLTESPDMAWHAYAVEYGLRVRELGLRTAAVDVPLTHNSLSVNLDRLDVAHQAIAAAYPARLPVRTTCGVVTRKTSPDGRGPLLPAYRWRYPWLRESLVLNRVRGAATQEAAVLADIRMDIDDVLPSSPGRRMHIINCAGEPRFVDSSPAPLELARRDATVVFSSCAPSEVAAALATCPAGSWQLVTNLDGPDAKTVSAALPAPPSVLGFHANIGFWLLVGPSRAELPWQWRSKRATPLGARALADA
jgi:Glycosyltransferase like family